MFCLFSFVACYEALCANLPNWYVNSVRYLIVHQYLEKSTRKIWCALLSIAWVLCHYSHSVLLQNKKSTRSRFFDWQETSGTEPMGDHIRTPRGSNPIIPPLQIGRGRYIRTSTEASRHVSTWDRLLATLHFNMLEKYKYTNST